MRELKAEKITQAVMDLVQQANFSLRQDVRLALRKAYRAETGRRAKTMLQAILDNAVYAQQESLAICQDTGLPIVFIRLGQDLRIIGDLQKAINKGIAAGYRKYCLRNSIVRDPVARGKPGFAPCIMHTDLVLGERIKITLLPKGFGCENKSQLKMFKPTAELAQIKQFVVEAVKSAGPDACPPYIVGVGIGGSGDYSGTLAKKALLFKLTAKRSRLENDLLKEINQTGIGVMGLGGKNTALAVKILTYPTHIAGLPVSVNISCHALRSAEIIL